MGKKNRYKKGVFKNNYTNSVAKVSVGPTLDTMEEVGEISNVQIVFGLPTGLPT